MICRFVDVRGYLPKCEDPRDVKAGGKGGKGGKRGRTGSGRRPGSSALGDQRRVDELAESFDFEVVSYACQLLCEALRTAAQSRSRPLRLVLAVNCTAGLHRPSLASDLRVYVCIVCSWCHICFVVVSNKLLQASWVSCFSDSQVPTFPNSQIPKFPDSQIPKFLHPRDSQTPDSHSDSHVNIPRFPNSQIPKSQPPEMPKPQIPIQIRRFPNYKFLNSQIARFPDAQTPDSQSDSQMPKLQIYIPKFPHYQMPK